MDKGPDFQDMSRWIPNLVNYGKDCPDFSLRSRDIVDNGPDCLHLTIWCPYLVDYGLDCSNLSRRNPDLVD